jgi:hypothetical protein
MRNLKQYFFSLIILLIIIVFGCYSINSGIKENVRIDTVEIQFIDAETEEPIPNISVQYYIRAERPVEGFIISKKHDHFLLTEMNILSDINGNIRILGNEYSVRSYDKIWVSTNINLDLDGNGILLEAEKEHGKNIYVDFSSYYFFDDNIYRDYGKPIDKKYYPAYANLNYNFEGTQSYIITQINDTGENIDFKIEHINNIIFGYETNKIIIRLYQIK